MHPQQKAAWFNLFVLVGTIALYLATVPLLSWYLGRPWKVVAEPAMGVFGLIGLSGFAVCFYRPRRDGKPSIDERDHLLALRTWRAGMVTFWLVFVFGCVGSWAFMRYIRGLQRVTVPVEVFPGMVFCAYMIFSIVQSVATLHYYGWRWHDASAR